MVKKATLIDFFKIKQTTLLVLSGLFGYLISEGRNADTEVISKLALALFLTIAGTTGFNMIFDRDIDALMFRTMKRPLPSKRLSLKKAYALSVVLFFLGLYISYTINFWVGFAAVLGFTIDVFLYTILLKRKTWTSILIGGIAGGAPIFGGYMAGTSANVIDAAIFLSILTLWSAVHIWFISIYFIDDFYIARIPTLPLVRGVKATSKVSIVLLTIMILCFFLLYLRDVLGEVSLFIIILSFIRVYTLIVRFLREPSRLNSKKVYKFMSVHLCIILLSITLEKILI